MKRREFITLFGGAAAAWPLGAPAQQVIPVIGFLGSASEATSAQFLEAFRQGLGDRGFVEGRNVRVDYRWADNQYDRLPSLASELVSSPVAVIVASGGPVAALAAKAATSTIPIVFTATSDPVKLGLVASLNRPGGNVTGSAMFTAELDPKRLELLRELAPTALVIGAFINPGRSDADEQSRNVQQAGRALGLQVIILSASNDRDIQSAFESSGWATDRGTLGRRRSFFRQPPRTTRGARGALWRTRHLHDPRVRRGWRTSKLWYQHCGWLPPSRNLRRPNSEGCQAR